MAYLKMIIYEVNLVVNNDIYDAFYSWLISHVKKMLQFKGFRQAEIANEKDDTVADKSKLIVRYYLDDEDNLNDYLKHHATRMREAGLNKFGNQFHAFRRILINSLLIVKEHMPS